jgi:hypothetical protein
MRITFGRKSRLAALGAGLMTAAALAVSASGPALADTADTGGTATISLTSTYLLNLAKSNVIVLPGAPVTSSFANGLDAYTLPVTGGNGEVSIFFGKVDFGGSLVLLNGKAGKTVTITNVQLNFFTGALTGQLPGGTTQTALGYFGGNEATSTSAGPPATESFSADQLNLSGKAAKALNTDLNTTAFARGTDIGTFATTFDVTVS